MKVKFDIECTPEEARTFFGLPDVVPMQEALVAQMQEKMAENIKTMDPETLAKTWMPLAMQNWSDMQKTFWGQMAGPTQNPMQSPAQNKDSDKET